MIKYRKEQYMEILLHDSLRRFVFTNLYIFLLESITKRVSNRHDILYDIIYSIKSI